MKAIWFPVPSTLPNRHATTASLTAYFIKNAVESLSLYECTKKGPMACFSKFG